MLTSKSRSVVARPQTVFASNWARENKDLYDDFTSTAFYLTPTDIDNEFSYDAYLNALEEGTLKPRTLGQWVLAKNRLLGSIAYENFIRKHKKLVELHLWIQIQKLHSYLNGQNNHS